MTISPLSEHSILFLFVFYLIFKVKIEKMDWLVKFLHLNLEDAFLSTMYLRLSKNKLSYSIFCHCYGLYNDPLQP
jgi:hypothetical protein